MNGTDATVDMRNPGYETLLRYRVRADCFRLRSITTLSETAKRNFGVEGNFGRRGVYMKSL
jgi:hypothetical protein